MKAIGGKLLFAVCGKLLFQVKLSDFGLAHEGLEVQNDSKAKVPLRWLAPETINKQGYSPKTDVWSYGILCWEIYNDGWLEDVAFGGVGRDCICVQ